MSALRILRQLRVTGASTRAFTAHPVSSVTRCRLPALSTRSFVTGLPATTRAFSVSARRLGEGARDIALSQKLAEELQYEEGATKDGAEPKFLRAFKDEGIWQIEDNEGHDEITLTRKFGNENIRFMFSITGMEMGEEEDGELEEEAERTDEGEEASSDDQVFHMYPIRASLSITKTTGPGALNVDATCQSGGFVFDNVSFYTDTKLGTELTAEADWKRRGLYIGPLFHSLDAEVVMEFEKFLQERGINESLALFIPQYVEYKEQKEYTKWLKNVKSFIEQ